MLRNSRFEYKKGAIKQINIEYVYKKNTDKI